MMPAGYLTREVLQKLQEQVEFFLNSKLEPMVRVPEDGFQQEWPANSQRVIDLLNDIYFEASIGQILDRNEREFLLSQIRQKCRKGKRRFTQYEAKEAEENPIVQAVLCFVNGQKQYEGRTADLLGILRDSSFADRFSQREGIPEFPRVFSERLRRLIPVLIGYGVEVLIEHRKTGSYCLISRMESFVIEPEETPKQTNEGDATEACVTSSSPVRHP